MSASPRETRLALLSRHAARLEQALVRQEALNERFFWLRLGTLFGGVLAVLLAYFLSPPLVLWSMLLLAAAAFAVVVFFHRRLDRLTLRFRLSNRETQAQIARMRLDWQSMPMPPADEPGAVGSLGDHPFAGDLNLLGERSIHRLVDTAVSQGGSRRLRDWLLEPVPNLEAINRRQECVRALVAHPIFRRRLALNGALITERPNERWDGEALRRWLARHAPGESLLPLLVLLGALSAVTITLFILNLTGVLPALWIGSLVLYGAIYSYQYSRLRDLFSEAQHLAVNLNKFRRVLVYLEAFPYREDALAQLAEPFRSAGQRPSRVLQHIARLASAASLQNNEFAWFLLNALVPWDFYFAYRLDGFKRRLSDLLPRWLDAWYELEALNSLANFAYLNPGYVFPVIERQADGRSGPVFEARELGHPLIPYERRVCNDFSVPESGQVTIVTGSNMSGKSTFLRTLGVNLALAYTGGVACAAGLRTAPFRLFTTIQVSDSLNDGISYFYAEVRRLRALLDELQRSHPYPLFFLIDEIFRGTNNLERQIGSQSYVQSLVGSRGAGVISTHDLELVHLADEFDEVRNFHFREEVEGDRMVFDYRLRPGPSPTTNALKIMQLEGLPVRPRT